MPLFAGRKVLTGRLHDTLEAGGYSGHRLERFLVRILFCLFADDTGIFEREAFCLYVVNRTAVAFTSERQRVEYLFALYEKLTAPLTATAKPAARKRRSPPLPSG